MTIKKLRNTDLKDFKLVIATVSTGNVGQLTADILINSLKMEKYALFYHPAIIPMIGPSAFSENPNEFSIASEFFVCESNKIVLLQIRSPITAFYLDSLFDEILDIIKSEGISEIIQLSSAFSFEQHFVQNSPFEFVDNDFFKETENLTSNFNKASRQQIPGCGIAIKLHNIATMKQIPSLVLFKYVSEGDNKFDAMQFAEKFNKLLDNPIGEKDGKIDLKIPISWKHMFGHNVNLDIY
ncbi:proteasome assembly chaperone 2 [Chironomus tepperi]|uniref:proteasome assembly chaperone 2 n=1 Tax=Chironomus tepperi TaxID=113505 RepID=UPI00391F9F31